MDPKKLDLNLVRVLATLYATRSVTRAAERLGLSQPTVSNALARLRQALGDELLVRSSQGLVPTAMLDRIGPAVATHLAALEASLGRDEAFDPRVSRRRWRLSLSDLGENLLLTPIVAAMRREAPHMRIENLGIPVDRLEEALVGGAVDLAIGALRFPKAGLRSVRLFDEGYVALAPASMRMRRLGIEQLARCPLVIASPSATYHSRLPMDLDRLRIGHAVVARLRHFSTIPDLVAKAGLVGIVPTSFGLEMAPRVGARVIELPAGFARFDVHMVWPVSRHHEPSDRWFRERVREVLSARA